MVEINIDPDREPTIGEVTYILGRILNLLNDFSGKITLLQGAENAPDDSVYALRLIVYNKTNELKKLLDQVNLESLVSLQLIIGSIHNNIGNVTKNADKAQIQMNTPVGDDLLATLQKAVSEAIQSLTTET